MIFLTVILYIWRAFIYPQTVDAPQNWAFSQIPLTQLSFDEIILGYMFSELFLVPDLRKGRIVRCYPRQFGSKNAKGKNQDLLFPLYFLLIFVACSLGCRQKAPTKTDVNAPKDKTTAAETASDTVVVTVNGVDITEGAIEGLIAPQLARLVEQSPNRSPAFIEQYKTLLRQQALEGMIVRRLLDDKVKGANITVTDEEVASRIETMASSQNPPLSLDDFKKKIEGYGQSFEEVKQQVRQGLVYQKFMERQWAGKINVTEEDAKKHYSENKERYEQVRASHILIKPDVSDPNTDPNQASADAKAKLQGLLEQIKDGADFAELAKSHSECPSAVRGGDLDFFKRGTMAPPFEKAAFEMAIDQVSDIVETTFGYHIIKVTDRKDTFEQFKDEVISTLTQMKQSEFAKQYIVSLKAEANIVYPSGQQLQPRGPVFPSPERK